MQEQLTQLQRTALLEIECHDKANPITGRDLANCIGLKPRRTGKEGADIRSIINALRDKGYPICATGRGYWWPKNERELSAYIASFEARVVQQERALFGLRAGFQKINESMADKFKNEKVELYEVWDPILKMTKVVQIVAMHAANLLLKHPEARKLA